MVGVIFVLFCSLAVGVIFVLLLCIFCALVFVFESMGCGGSKTLLVLIQHHTYRSRNCVEAQALPLRQVEGREKPHRGTQLSKQVLRE